MRPNDKIINIEITAGGKVNIDMQGFKGRECVDATQQIELVLGGEAKQTKKSDYYASPITNQQSTKLQF